MSNASSSTAALHLGRRGLAGVYAKLDVARHGLALIALVVGVGGISACLKVPQASGTQNNIATGATAASSPIEQQLRAAVSLDQHFQVGEVRGYEYLQEGEPLGRVVTRVLSLQSEPAPGRIELESKVEWRGAGSVTQRLLHRFVLDMRGHLLEAWSESAALRWKFEQGPDGLDLIEDTGIGNPSRRRVSERRDLVPLAFMSPLLLEAELVARELREDENWSLISLSSGSIEAWSAKIKALSSEQMQQNGAPLRLYTSLGEEIDWGQAGIQSIAVPADHLEVRPLSHPSYPDWNIAALKRLRYQPSGQESFVREAFELPPTADNPYALAGEWLIPSGKEPHPALLFLGPSWKADRFGFSGPPATDLGAHAWTDRLAQAGWWVARFDEPGTGQSPPIANAGWESDRNDAQRVLGAMMVDPRVDPSRIVIVGHGEGAWLAWSLAKALPRHLKGILALAAPLQGVSALMGDDPAALQRLRQAPRATLPAELKWIQSALEVQPQVLAEQSPVPTCFGFAKLDAQLPVAASLQQLQMIWQGRDSSQQDRYFVVPGVDHLWMSSVATQNAAAAYENTRPVAPAALQSAIECLREWAGPTKMPPTPLAVPVKARTQSSP